VIHTDDMTRNAQAVMNSTFDFLGLHRIAIAPKDTRVCVRGKAGVMDSTSDFEANLKFVDHSGKAGGGTRVDEAPHNAGREKTVEVGDCDMEPEGMHRVPGSGALHHNIEPALLRRLRDYYAASNEDLFTLLGRRFDW
jgi:hypothetical protein